MTELQRQKNICGYIEWIYKDKGKYCERERKKEREKEIRDMHIYIHIITNYIYIVTHSFSI